MQKTNKSTRRNFLISVPAAIISLSAFSFLKFKKIVGNSEKKIKTLSLSEADEIIKNEKFPDSGQIIPAAAPVAQKSING